MKFGLRTDNRAVKLIFFKCIPPYHFKRILCSSIAYSALIEWLNSKETTARLCDPYETYLFHILKE